MKIDLFVNEVSNQINNNNCELFVGSGISKGSGLPTWEELLKPLAQNIDIDINKNDDLPLIAQYIVNSNGGHKNVIYNRIMSCFSRKFELNDYHAAISNLNVKTVWTTNYDSLLEKCFINRNPRVIRNNNDLSKPVMKQELEIIKLHGCIDGDLNDIVLTRQEYDEFLFNKPAIAQRLRDTFINKSILFIGYGYRDYNIRNIMIEATKQSNRYSQDHYIVLLNITREGNENEESFKQRIYRFNLWIKELNRIGIKECIVDSEKELTKLLQEIALKSRGKSIYVSGSHENYAVQKCKEYGRNLAEFEDVIMINGQNQGVGSTVINSFMDEKIKNNKELIDVVKYYPNPYAVNPKYSNDVSLLPKLKSARMNLFANTKLFVVFRGGMGTKAEVEVAKSMNCLILVAIQNKEDYDDKLISALIEDDYCVKCMKNAEEYYNILKNKKVPSIQNLVDATRKLIND